MIPRFLFGGSFDSLAGQRMQYDQMAVQAAERDRAMRAEAAGREQQAQMFAQRQAEENARQNEAIRFQFHQADQSAAERAQQTAQQRYQFGAELGARQTQNASELALRREDMGFRQGQMKANQTLQDQDADYSEALHAIQSGVIDDPQKIATMFPRLQPLQMQRAAAYLDTALKGQNEDYRSMESGATGLNAIVNQARLAKWKTNLATDLATKTQGMNGPRWMGGIGLDSTLKAEMDKTLQTPPSDLPHLEDNEIDSILSKVRNQKLLQSVQWNNQAQRFEPVVSKPARYQFNAGPSQVAQAPVALPAPRPVPNTNGAPVTDFSGPRITVPGGYPPGTPVSEMSPANYFRPQPVGASQMPAGFYDRVNELIATGVDPRMAKRTAMAEFGRL